MADIALDLNPLHKGQAVYGDILITSGDITLTSDAEPTNALATNPVLQNILQRMRFFLGEWFLDNSQGLPYFQQILTKKPDQSKIDAIFLNVIMGTPGVTQISSYSFSMNNTLRVLTVSFACVTTAGIVSYAGNVPVTGGQT
jgi:hypothetical protein